jgi:hypothetical protein
MTHRLLLPFLRGTRAFDLLGHITRNTTHMDNRDHGARRRRSGGGPGGGCVRRPVGIPSPPRGGRLKPRSRARLGTVGGYEGRQLDPQDQQLSGKPCT